MYLCARSCLALAFTATFALACSGNDRGDDDPLQLPRDSGEVERDAGSVVRDGGNNRDAGDTRDGGSFRDGGQRDGGATRDGGPRDGGSLRDSGSSTPRDGGVPPPDAGAPGFCGNGICEDGTNGTPNLGENFIVCPADCSPPVACPPGQEGCPCTSSFVPGATAYAQDNCATGDLCIPWDALSTVPGGLTGPVQSCVSPCVVDADCGVGPNGPRFCANLDVLVTNGPPVGTVCVDRIAGIDEFCGGSRNTTPRLSGATNVTGSEMVGCPGDARCLFGAVSTFDPDEGACVQFCGAGLPQCDPTVPYCNPVDFPLGSRVGTSTVGTSTAGATNVGFCNVAQLGFGSLSNLTESPDVAGFASLCDAAAPADLVTLDLNVIAIPGALCVEECNQGGTQPDSPCVTVDANNPVVCAVLDFATGDGICIHSNASAFPDTCQGVGAYGLGRQEFGVVFGSAQIPASWCLDRMPPALTPGALSSAGALTSPGDNCGAIGLDFLRCPEPAFCAGNGAGGGVCLAGCALGGTTCAASLTTLGSPAANATCTMIGIGGTEGVCGGD
ncbi:MAG: hypothetical protein RMA76_07225 [Deltaproteobacteria bacterium]|jgi:hypothetical protein